MKDWYQYRPWNVTHRIPLRKSVHMSYHTPSLLPNSCGPIADCPFRDPKGRSYPHPKYWTHRWWIDINIGHGISPINPINRSKAHDISYDSKYQIAAAQWWMVHFGTPRVSPIHIYQISDPSIKDWYQYRPWNLTYRAQLRESMHMTSHTTALLPNSCGPMADGLFRDPKGRSYLHLKYWTHRWRIDINIGHGISTIEPS